MDGKIQPFLDAFLRYRAGQPIAATDDD